MATQGPYEHPCHLCKVPSAAFGFGWPGSHKDRPDDTILWACALHRQDVERINKERIGIGAST